VQKLSPHVRHFAEIVAADGEAFRVPSLSKDLTLLAAVYKNWNNFCIHFISGKSPMTSGGIIKKEVGGPPSPSQKQEAR
jgi:hypothetical protein